MSTTGHSTSSCLLVLLFLGFCFADPVRAQTSGSADPSAQTLIGTIISSDFTGAVLIDEQGKQTFYRARERLPDGSQVLKVRSDSISVRRSDGSVHELYIRQRTNPSSGAAGPAAVAGAPARAAGSPSVFAQPGQRFERPQKRTKSKGSRRRFRTGGSE